MGEHGERFPLAVLKFQAGQRLRAWGVVAQDQHGGFGEGPLEVSMADLLARGARALAGGFFGSLDEPAVRDEVLPPGKALEVIPLLEHP